MTDGRALYTSSSDHLLAAVREVAKRHPAEVLALDSPFDLFKLGLETDGNATLGMAQAALSIVKAELRKEGR